MTDDSLADRMQAYEAAADTARQAARDRDQLAAAIDADLAEHVETALAEEGTTVEAVNRSADGHTVRFEARLDRAAMVAALTESLPGGFVVSHLNENGSLSIEWTGDGRTPGRRERGAVLKAIVAEETQLDSDGLITASPSHDRVLDRAAELGIDRDDAQARLSRLAELDVIDVVDGTVYPDENFSRI
jgi:DNA-binding protein H-NS